MLKIYLKVALTNPPAISVEPQGISEQVDELIKEKLWDGIWVAFYKMGIRIVRTQSKTIPVSKGLKMVAINLEVPQYDRSSCKLRPALTMESVIKAMNLDLNVIALLMENKEYMLSQNEDNLMTPEELANVFNAKIYGPIKNSALAPEYITHLKSLNEMTRLGVIFNPRLRKLDIMLHPGIYRGNGSFSCKHLDVIRKHVSKGITQAIEECGFKSRIRKVTVYFYRVPSKASDDMCFELDISSFWRKLTPPIAHLHTNKRCIEADIEPLELTARVKAHMLNCKSDFESIMDAKAKSEAHKRRMADLQNGLIRMSVTKDCDTCTDSKRSLLEDWLKQLDAKEVVKSCDEDD